MSDIVFTLLAVAAIFTVAALAGLVVLLRPDPEPLPPPWVNHAAVRRPCDRPTRRGDWREDCTT